MAPDTTQHVSGSGRGMPALVVRLGHDAPEPGIDYCGTGRVARVLVGRDVGEVVPVLGRMFAICPAAQQLAARLALAAAEGEMDGSGEIVALAGRARGESLREHGLRVLLGWSAALGETPDRELAARVNLETRGDALDEVAERIGQWVFGGPTEQWLVDENLARWAARGETLAARFVARALAEDMVPQAPAMPSGTLVERHAAHRALAGLAPGSLATFHAARLADLARLVAGGGREMPAAQLTGPGAAQVTVDCSRGALSHRVRVTQGRVSGYEIVSPTDAAFADEGFGRRWLDAVATLPADGREGAVHAILAALDPCTETRVELV